MLFEERSLHIQANVLQRTRFDFGHSKQKKRHGASAPWRYSDTRADRQRSTGALRGGMFLWGLRTSNNRNMSAPPFYRNSYSGSLQQAMNKVKRFFSTTGAHAAVLGGGYTKIPAPRTALGA